MSTPIGDAFAHSRMDRHALSRVESHSVLFIDPGKMTGFGFLRWRTTAVAGIDPDSMTFEGAELSHDDFLDWVTNTVAYMRNFTLNPPPSEPIGGWIDRMVIEGYSITERTVKIAPDDRELWSVKQIGHVETLSRWHGIPWERQMPADKSYAEGRPKLEALGWWKAAEGVKGEAGHRRDAARHAIRWGVKNQIIDPRKFLT